MERISVVACGRSSRSTAFRGLCCLLCVHLTTLGVCWSADPAKRTAAQRPSRPTRQAQGNSRQSANVPETTVDDGFGAETEREAPAEDVDELPEHVHPDHPIVPALKMAYASRATMRQVQDYTAQFVKKELVDGRYITQSMDLKFREQPFSVYLRFKNPHEGRQVLYVKGANGGQILVRETGLGSLAGTIPINPTDPLALTESRHPITEIGISNMLEAVIRQWEAEGRYAGVDVKYFPEAKLGTYPVKVIRTTYAKPYRQFKFHITQLYLDEKSLFPVRVEQFDWPKNPGDKPTLVEQYMYSGVRTNQKLGPGEFAPRTYGM